MSLLSIFKDKKVLVTGIAEPSVPSNFSASFILDVVEDHRIDIREAETFRLLVEKTQPDFVFHLAAQALVRSSYENPLETITTNALGSANVLDAMRVLDKKAIAIMITSDKAYDNVEWVWGYRESDRLGGKDPYSASKGMAELAIRSYVESYFSEPDSNVRIGITRAGNVIGGGDWAQDRIVPDCIKAWSRNERVDIRSPRATRPWQHVLEPLSGYLTLGAELYQDGENHGEAYNFGPSANQNYSVSELINEMAKYWDYVRWNDTSNSVQHVREAALLKLNCDKALFDLNWTPTLQFIETVQMTVEWYKEFYEANSDTMYDYSMGQILEYTKLAKDRGINWAQL